MTKILIKGGEVVSGGKQKVADVLIEDGKIVAIDNNITAENSHVIDAEGLYVSAGFIDLHTHGGGGADFMDGSVEAYQTALKTHAQHGTTLLYPTTLPRRLGDSRHAAHHISVWRYGIRLMGRSQLPHSARRQSWLGCSLLW